MEAGLQAELASGHQMSVAVEIKTFGILFDFDFDY